jgi:hypothetical protein
MQLDARERRLSTVVYLQDLLEDLPGGHVVVTGMTGTPEERMRQILGAHGRRVTEASDTLRLGVADGTADLVLLPEVASGDIEAALAEARRAIKSDGLVVVGCESRDRPGAKTGMSYFDLVDRLEAHFAKVTMVGLAPFAGATLVEYGAKDPEPVLDGTLVAKGERVEFYLAIAGAKKHSAGGYTVVQLPAQAVEAPKVTAPKAEAPKPSAKIGAPADHEIGERLRQREKAIEEFRSAALVHLKEMEKVKAELRERDAYVAELELDARERDRLRDDARRAIQRADVAEERERKARLELARCQGQLLRAGPAAQAPTATAAPTTLVADSDLSNRVQKLEAENAKLKAKEEDARAESWKHLKARSDAEAQAAEVREDTVRKLKDARKLASVELTRAMEEATRKAVGLKDELERTLRERKEHLAEIERLKRELESRRSDGLELAEERLQLAREDEEVERLHAQMKLLERATAEAEGRVEAERERAAELTGLVRQLENEAAEARQRALEGHVAHGTAVEAAEAERARFERMLADVEQRAVERAQVALRIRASLKEREREVEALRRELHDRDTRLVQLEKMHPPGEAEEHLGAELQASRARLAELTAEMQRREAATERAAAAAAHERARAERLVSEERRALADRNEARARLAEVEARAAALSVEKERLELALSQTRGELDRAEAEVRERKERSKQLKRDLEDAERRAQACDVARERLGAMEQALRGEEQRLAAMEDALRRAAAELPEEHR